MRSIPADEMDVSLVSQGVNFTGYLGDGRQATIDPTKLSKRIKKRVVKNLRCETWFLDGTSASGGITQLLATQYRLSQPKCWLTVAHLGENYSQEVIDKVRERHAADSVARALSTGMRLALRPFQPPTITFFDPHFATLARRDILTMQLHHEAERTERAIEALHGMELIHIYAHPPKESPWNTLT